MRQFGPYRVGFVDYRPNSLHQTPAAAAPVWPVRTATQRPVVGIERCSTLQHPASIATTPPPIHQLNGMQYRILATVTRCIHTPYIFHKMLA